VGAGAHGARRNPGDAAGKITETDWAQVKEIYAERALDIIERHAPGLRQKIIGRTVVSPLDLEADNPNLVGGDQMAGSHHLSQNFLFRPASAMPREKPPSTVCTSPAPASGRVRVPGRVQAICSPRSWAGNEHPK
jgi:phytoene dehydrogenase-like protein